MSDLNANLYDLLDAQLMLDALLPKQRGSSLEKKPQASLNKYLDLSSFGLSMQNPAGKVDLEEVEKRLESTETALLDFEGWEDIIAWCMSFSHAETGFVVDSQGFVIASRGRLPGQGIEGIGAELVCSIEQLERIDPDAGRLLCVEMDFDKRRLMGFSAGTDEHSKYVLGLIAPEPLDNSSKHRILKQIAHNLPNLD